MNGAKVIVVSLSGNNLKLAIALTVGLKYIMAVSQQMVPL